MLIDKWIDKKSVSFNLEQLSDGWQRLVIPKLLETFPNCQFFISTHSPQVISHVEQPECIFLLKQTEEGLTCNKTEETYGMSLDRVVDLVMEDESRPEENSIPESVIKKSGYVYYNGKKLYNEVGNISVDEVIGEIGPVEQGNSHLHLEIFSKERIVVPSFMDVLKEDNVRGV